MRSCHDCVYSHHHHHHHHHHPDCFGSDLFYYDDLGYDSPRASMTPASAPAAASKTKQLADYNWVFIWTFSIHSTICLGWCIVFCTKFFHPPPTPCFYVGWILPLCVLRVRVSRGQKFLFLNFKRWKFSFANGWKRCIFMYSTEIYIALLRHTRTV
jgi:hypothetical protein